jgi:hypothetical protein
MVANFVGGDHWGGVFDADATRQYQDWKRRVESLRYQFINDLDQLTALGTDIFNYADGEQPIIVNEF